jgi:hypothetical protein
MQGVLTRVGDHPFAKACAALLAVLVVGSITGSVLAAYGEGRACWPQAMYYTIYAECENELFQRAWTVGVSLPIMMLQGPVNLLINVTSGQPFSLGIIDTFTLMVTPLIVFFGFAGWLRLASPVAWLLLLALVGEIVYLRTLVPV